jgi:hypothetical protein
MEFRNKNQIRTGVQCINIGVCGAMSSRKAHWAVGKSGERGFYVTGGSLRQVRNRHRNRNGEQFETPIGANVHVTDLECYITCPSGAINFRTRRFEVLS